MIRTAIVLLASALASSAFAQERIRSELNEKSTSADMVRSLSVQAPEGKPVEVSMSLQVQFAFGSAQLNEQGIGTLDLVADVLNDPGLVGHAFLVEGHTDAVGTDKANLKLSEARAKAALEYLIGRGVDQARLQMAGFGERKPLQGVNPEDGRNRRVEFVRLP